MKAFTDKYIQSLKPKEKQYYVREARGFAVRVLPSGVKTFLYIYTFKGKRRQLNLGNYPGTKLSEAHQKYRNALDTLASGNDPQGLPIELSSESEEPQATTITALKSKYIEHIKTHLVPRSVKHQSERLEKHLIPAWGNRSVTSVRRRDAIELIESIASEKPGAARNVLLAARSMFTYAVHREMIEYNPFSGVGVAVPQAAPNTRERVLNHQEIKHSWDTLSIWGGSETIRRAILFVLVTAQRPGEVTGMHRSEIDKTGRWWTIPAERSKNGRENKVYLSYLARKLLPQSDGYIFPAGRGAEGPVYVNSLSHHLSHHNKPPYLGLERWTPHDLRRTAATQMSEMGCSDEIIDAILNHKKQGVIGIYNRNKYDREKREWLIRWGKLLKKITK